MSTPTILRVKRLRTQDPSNVIVIKATKRKAASEDGEEPNNFKILKLAATVENKGDTDKLNETVNKILSKKTVPKSFEELKERYKKSCSVKNATEEGAKAARENRDEQRFRLISQKRAIRIEDLEDWPEDDTGEKEENKEGLVDGKGASKELFRLYDVVDEEVVGDKDTDIKPKPADDKISCNGVEMIREYVSKGSDDEEGFVYDVYYSEGGVGGGQDMDFDDSLLDGLFSIQPFNSGEDLMYEDYRDFDKVEFGEDEDSNDEDNYRNEYPDEEDDSDEDFGYRGYCDDDGELGSRIKGLGIESESDDLSSEGEDDLVFTRSFAEDTNMHGLAYARFKKNTLKGFQHGLAEDDDDTDSDFN